MSLNNPDNTKIHQPSKPNILTREEHNISRKDISDGALKVLYRLNNAGFDAFLVGGSVRDLLLGKHPKDFDISTNATPEEIKKLFGNARIIGRRFRIVHVRFGKEIIEVVTFRASHTEEDCQINDSLKSLSGILLRDNVYGSVEEDAIRRDFTVNALYYTVHNFSVHDYTDGIEDLKNCNLRMIGNPILRYQEDPVRMLRAVRFATKLNFKIEINTAEPIPRMAKLLAEIPPARLFEEILKLFMAGHAMENFAQLCHYNLFEQLFPHTSQYLGDPIYPAFIEHACTNTDNRINSDKYVTPAFLFAVLLWPQVNELTKKFHLEGLPLSPARHEAIQVAIQQQLHHTAIPKRFSTPMREIWELQLALENVHSKRAHRILSHKRFRAAYDFLILREQVGEKIGTAGTWWTEFQQADAAKQQAMLDEMKRGKSSGNRKRR